MGASGPGVIEIASRRREVATQGAELLLQGTAGFRKLLQAIRLKERPHPPNFEKQLQLVLLSSQMHL